MDYDVIVLGLGAMGSSACYHLARRGARVLGLEQFQKGHDRGSSHGEVRLFRKAYFEHPDYVPLLHQSEKNWRELEARVGKKLFHPTGLVMFGADDSAILRGVERSAFEHQIPIEKLSEKEIPRKFPWFRVPSGYRAIYEPGAGFLEVESAVRAHWDAARSLGADLREDESVLDWSAERGRVKVVTSRGTYEARHLVLTLGAWTKTLSKMTLPLKVCRAPQFWFPAEDRFQESAGFPCFAYDLPGGFVYGFPRGPKGMKIAHHKAGDEVEDPTHLDRTLHAGDATFVSESVEKYLPGVSARFSAVSVCLYTMTPDENFVIDRHPQFSEVTLAAGFSGHGFKFASWVGEALAELSLEGKTSLSIDFLKMR